MNVRARTLLDLAHLVHQCQNCDRHVEHGCDPAHQNGISAGKGQGIKSHDHRHAAFCNDCHRWYDSVGGRSDPSGLYQPTREDKFAMWVRAHLRTMDIYWSRGWLTVNPAAN